MNESVITSIIVALSALIGAALGAGSSVVAARHAAREQRLRNIRELGLQVALANFEACWRVAERSGVNVSIPPLKVFIIQGIEMMEILNDPTLGRMEKIARIKAVEDFASAVARAAERGD